MSVCKAAVLTTYKEPLELQDFTVPEVGPGEALIRVEMAGICGTDVHLCDGELNIPLPVILGHETVGRIEKLGEGLTQDWRNAPSPPGTGSHGPVPWFAANATIAGSNSSPRAACRAKRTASPTAPRRRRTCEEDTPNTSYCARVVRFFEFPNLCRPIV